MAKKFDIRVLKEFVFNHAKPEFTKIFKPGLHEDVHPEIATHPWIKAGADGFIELEPPVVEEPKKDEAAKDGDAKDGGVKA